jgi:hypothetical protein
VIKTVRPKYSCKGCDSVVQALAPQRVINKGLPSAGLLTQVMVDKYMDHQPLYRQSQQMTREGIDVERSTLADWVGQVSRLLTPLAEAIERRHVTQASNLHAETPHHRHYQQVKDVHKRDDIGRMLEMVEHGMKLHRLRSGYNTVKTEKVSIRPRIYATLLLGHCKLMRMLV